MPTITLNVSEEMFKRIEKAVDQTGETVEDLILDATEGLLDHWDEMFASIKTMMEENPNMSLDDLEKAWKEKNNWDDLDEDEDEAEDHVHNGKGCCSVQG